MVNPCINEDGTWTQFDGYQTDILADRVVEFIQSTPADQPFFAMYTPTTPHMPADDPRYDGHARHAARGSVVRSGHDAEYEPAVRAAGSPDP